MTKTLNKKNYFFITAFTSTKVLLVLGALAIAVKPDLILNFYIKTIFCLLVLGIGIALIAMKRLHKADCFSVISHYYMRKTNCFDQDCLLTHKKKNTSIFLSVCQDLIGFAFAISSFFLVYNIFFNKILNSKILFFSRIYCGVFSISILASALITVMVNFIGYKYCKYKLTHGTDEEKNKFKKDILSKSNGFINFLNFFHSIANILLSIHFYACHLFVTRDHFKANFIALDNGIRGKTDIEVPLNLKEAENAINTIGICSECNCKNLIDKTNKYHVETNLSLFHVFVMRENQEDIKYIREVKAREYLDDSKVGIKFNMFGVEMMSLRFQE